MEFFNNDPVLAFVVCGLVVVAITFIGIWIVRAFAGSALNARISLSPQQIKRGQELNVGITICPRFSLEIDMIEITITCERTYRERHRGGWGSSHRDSHTEVDNICKETTYLPVDTMVGTGEEKSYTVKIIVPGEGLPTKRKTMDWGEDQGISIEWFVTIRFDIKSFPDAILRYNIVVQSGLDTPESQH